MEAKFKVGDRVRVLDCPVMPDAIGKSGIIRHTQGDLYRVEVDGKVIPDYALEADIELIRTQSPWISVTDSLPEVDTIVLTKGAYGYLLCFLSTLGEWETGAYVNEERLGIDFYGMPNDLNVDNYHKATVEELIEHFKGKEESCHHL